MTHAVHIRGPSIWNEPRVGLDVTTHALQLILDQPWQDSARRTCRFFEPRASGHLVRRLMYRRRTLLKWENFPILYRERDTESEPHTARESRNRILFPFLCVDVSIVQNTFVRRLKEYFVCNECQSC